METPVYDIVLRKKWLNFEAEDEELIKEIDILLENNIEQLIDYMYTHFLDFPETRRFFPDEISLRRAQEAQKSYFRRLTKGNYDSEYVAQRLSVGSTHYRIGLDPMWYLGAYNRAMSFIRSLVRDRYLDDPEREQRVLEALRRLIFFDMGLAIESYTVARERAIREQSDAIKELETQRRVTRSILEDAPIGIARLDVNLTVAECNPEFSSMIGLYEPDQLIGRKLSELAPCMPMDLFETVLNTGLPSKHSAKFMRFTVDESPGYFDLAVWPVREETGVITALVCMFVVATDRVKLQQQREDFVATLTHDLKTPILAANRAIKLLMEGDFGPVVEGQSKILEVILQSNTSLYNLVQTLLDVYRYDSGVKRLSFVEQELNLTVSLVAKELQSLCDTKKIQLDIDLPEKSPLIRYDSAELRRVLQNLLDNSLKFTPSGGKIKVSVQQFDEYVRVTVSDTGKGISPEDLPKLFDRFWQAASGGGSYYAGTGLGLYLCRKIVELHGGKIACESSPGKGSSFYFTLPFENEENGADSSF